MRPAKILESICVVMATFACVSVGFVVDSDCMADLPCHCTSGKIWCNNNHLTTIPVFHPATAFTNNLTILLPANDLTVIPGYAFYNINTTRATSISILFQTNKLYRIVMNAFTGIENAIVELHFEDNKFTTVPAALTRLTALKTLRMQANPITTIDPVVMSQMSLTLEEFSVPAENLTAWPYALSHLRHLNYLLLYGITSHHLPLDAFFGFGSFLTELHISGSFYGGVPSAVCFLRNLQELSVNSNTFKTQSQMIELHDKCQQLLSKVDTFIHI